MNLIQKYKKKIFLEGHRRVHTRRTSRKNYCEEEEGAQPAIPPESVHTLNKLKKVIDSDSE